MARRMARHGLSSRSNGVSSRVGHTSVNLARGGAITPGLVFTSLKTVQENYKTEALLLFIGDYAHIYITVALVYGGL